MSANLNMMFKEIILLFLGLAFSLPCMAVSPECVSWFDKLKISKNEKCISHCEVGKIDMGTFACRVECKDLCLTKSSLAEYSLLKTYGLTDDEIKICDESPMKCVQSYKLSWDAEKICLTKYSDSRTNDESDACRHFTWAILMAKNIDENFAESLLNAHENNPHEPENERAMDLSNNRLGLLTYQKLKSSNNELINEAIAKEFQRKLDANALIILKSRFGKP